MNNQNITLISFSHFNKDFLQNIAESISKEYLHNVVIKELHLDLSELYNPSRRQYDANQILQQVHQLSPENSIKSLGLFTVDLFIPILTFIFGQAFLNGNTGIASTYRLKNELYGIKPNEDLLQNRFNKVCIHELGHSFGLVHCHTPTCVMRSSTYVEDIDQKENSLCINCREKLKL